MVFYDENDNPYRWAECEFYEYDGSNKAYTYKLYLTTDNLMDDYNKLKLTNLMVPGSTDRLYGFFGEYTKAEIYILAKIPLAEGIEYPRKDIDNIAPGFEEYTLTNIYTCADGIRLFQNYTDVLDSKVTVENIEGTLFKTTGVPLVGRHYIRSESQVKYFIEAINERKAYIEYCLSLIEQSMNIDFKYFNTYGPSKTYRLENRVDPIGPVDITMRFKLSLRNEYDTDTRDAVLQSIKSYIENLYVIGDWHAPNLITDIINEYESVIFYIEYVGFNTWGADDQHIMLMDVDDPHTVPEFLNIRNIYDEETDSLVPCIAIEIV